MWTRSRRARGRRRRRRRTRWRRQTRRRRTRARRRSPRRRARRGSRRGARRRSPRKRPRTSRGARDQRRAGRGRGARASPSPRVERETRETRGSGGCARSRRRGRAGGCHHDDDGGTLRSKMPAGVPYLRLASCGVPRGGAGDAAGGVAVERHVRGRLETRGESVEVARDFVWRGGSTTGREDPIANTVSNPRSRGALREFRAPASEIADSVLCLVILDLARARYTDARADRVRPIRDRACVFARPHPRPLDLVRVASRARR